MAEGGGGTIHKHDQAGVGVQEASVGCRGGCWQVLLWWLCCKGLLDSGVDWGRWWEGVATLSVGAAHLAVSLTWRPSSSGGGAAGCAHLEHGLAVGEANPLPGRWGRRMGGGGAR